MLIELPAWKIIVLNCIGWPLVQVGLAWFFTKLPDKCLRPPRGYAWEPWLYRRVLRVPYWKDRLPDAAAWFSGGFAKRSLEKIDPDYINKFIRETWRGEFCHWCALAAMPVFFLWNPGWADFIIFAYATAANLPCILTQRHNRLRLRNFLQRTQDDMSQIQR